MPKVAKKVEDKQRITCTIKKQVSPCGDFRGYRMIAAFANQESGTPHDTKTCFAKRFVVLISGDHIFYPNQNQVKDFEKQLRDFPQHATDINWE